MSGVNDEKIYQAMTEKNTDSATIKLEAVHYGDYREHPGIKKIRTILLVLLCIEMVFAIYHFFSYVTALVRYGSLPENYKHDLIRAWLIRKLLGAIIGIFYLGVFILVVVKYIRTGLLIFAWLSLIQLIAIGFIVVLSVIGVMAATSSVDQTGVGVLASFIIILLVGLFSLITVFIVVFSFKLAKLIKIQEENPMAHRPVAAL